jgi:HEAT repeat protein
MSTSVQDIDELIATLTGGSLDAAIKAENALAEIGEPVVEPLIALLSDSKYSNIWWLVAGALERIGDKRAVEPLIRMLENPASRDYVLARKYAAYAFAELKDARAVDVLIGMLHERLHVEEDDEIYDEPEHETIAAVAGALTKIGDPRALEPLVNRLLEGNHWHQDALIRWGEPAMLLLLEALKSEDANRRHIAASLLEDFHDLRAVDSLIDILKNDSNNDVRSGAAYSLGRIRNPKAFDALLTALSDPYKRTRYQAATSLGLLGDVRAIEALKRATEDENMTVRHHAAQALEMINAHINSTSNQP